MMDGYNLVGRIRPVYRGVWNAETAYTVLETVTTADNRAAYIAVKDVPAGVLLSNEEYWGLLVDVGGLTGGGSGEAGEDGGYYSPSVAADGTLTWTASKSGMPTVPGANIRGPAGNDGAKGDKGDTGDTGAQGPKGDKGDKGDAGATGPAGYTPVKGTDYWTGADQEAIVQQVIAALGTPVFGTVDVDNNIVLTGELVDGDYTIRYEAADGTTTVIGTLEIGGTAAYINVLDTVGWLENKRISTSSGYAERDNEGTDLTGYIPVSTGDVIRMKNVTMPQTSTGYDNQVYYYDNSKVGKGGASIAPPNYDSVADSAGNIIQFKVGSAWTTDGTGFIRIGAANIDSTSVITINEVIE